jgi:hypothetical protein
MTPVKQRNPVAREKVKHNVVGQMTPGVLLGITSHKE